MSIARKCDRCHNFYDPYNCNIVIVKADDWDIQVDLCPSCQEKLEKWVSEYEFFDSVCEEAKDVPETE